MTPMIRPSPVAPAATLCALLVLGSARPRAGAADDLLQKARAMYVDLTSYADTGVVTVEYGKDSVDKHTFVTRFNRAPRRFLFEFTKQGGERFVVWGDPDAFHTWWKATGDRYDYPNPNNAPALNNSGPNTKSAILKIPTLLYGKAALLSDFANFGDATPGPIEDVGGHECQKISGTARDVYAATGHEVNLRKMDIWIDTRMLLVRRVREEWTAPAGQRSRVTTSLEPQINPAIPDAQFAFTPPRAGGV